MGNRLTGAQGSKKGFVEAIASIQARDDDGLEYGVKQ